MIGIAPPRPRAIAIYKPLPWQVAPWRDTSPTILLTGSAGGGKSRVAAEKLHGFCLKYPGATALLVRKARVSITNSTALLFDRLVMGNDRNVKHLMSKSRFEYRNGSMLLYTGLDDDQQRERLRSIGLEGGVDIAWMEEATEFDQEDYTAVDARLRGTAAPWRQLILTCNPDAPTHWIYSQLIAGQRARVYYSQASDNPYNPDDYLTRLSNLDGVEGDRLARGLWVQSTGLVYQDQWQGEGNGGNVTHEADYDPSVPVLWALDDGYSGKVDPKTGLYPANAHPRVILFAQVKGDSHLDIFDELYQTQTLPENHIQDALDKGYPVPDRAVVDSSAATLKRRITDKEVQTQGGTHEIAEGVKHMRSWLAADGNGFRRIRVHPRCRHLRSELNSYKLKPGSETPEKAFDHGPDALRYLAWALRYEAD